MGGGRKRLDDRLDLSAGITFQVKPGERVSTGDVVATVFAATSAKVERGLAGLAECATFGDTPEWELPLISHRVTTNGTEVLA